MANGRVQKAVAEVGHPPRLEGLPENTLAHLTEAELVLLRKRKCEEYAAGSDWSQPAFGTDRGVK
jgi:hypothetical protein